MRHRDTDFPAGVVIFFRSIIPGEAGGPSTLARSIHPQGRAIEMGGYGFDDQDYIILDADGHFVAAYPRDYIAGIMPLTTEGPARTGGSSAPN
jgi:hypothetical protein